MFSWLVVQNSDWELSTSETPDRWVNLSDMSWRAAGVSLCGACECKAADGPKENIQWEDDLKITGKFLSLKLLLLVLRTLVHNPSIYKSQFNETSIRNNMNENENTEAQTPRYVLHEARSGQNPSTATDCGSVILVSVS